MRTISAILILCLAACSSRSDPGSDNQGAPGAPASSGETAPGTGAPGTNVPASPDQGVDTSDSKSPQAAAAVLRRYFALLDAGRYGEAWNLWSDDGRSSGMSRTDFARSFEKYRSYDAVVGRPGRIEGAAGSLYVEIPATVTGRLRSGGRFKLEGPVTLRRANDVPGATQEQLQWRIYRSDLDPRPQPQPAAYRFVGRWATEEGNCSSRAWRFTAERLTTPAGSVCTFRRVREAPGGYDIAARCTAEGPPTDDTLRLRFAESARALLFESDVIADAGLVRCR